MSDAPQVEQGRKEAAGTSRNIPPGRNTPHREGNNWKDNVVRKQHDGGAVSMKARNIEKERRKAMDTRQPTRT